MGVLLCITARCWFVLMNTSWRRYEADRVQPRDDEFATPCAFLRSLQWLSVANAVFRYYQALPKAGLVLLPSLLWITVGEKGWGALCINRVVLCYVVSSGYHTGP